MNYGLVNVQMDIVIDEWPLEADWDVKWFLQRSYSVTQRQNSQEKTVTEMKCRHYYYFIASLIILSVSVRYKKLCYTQARQDMRSSYKEIYSFNDAVFGLGARCRV